MEKQIRFAYTHELTSDDREQVLKGDLRIVAEESIMGRMQAALNPEGIRKDIEGHHFQSGKHGLYAMKDGKVAGHALFGNVPLPPEKATIPEIKAAFK